MKILLMLLALVAAAILQAVFPTWRWTGQATAPILLGVVMYYALSHSRATMLQAAILAGLLQDALGMIPLGYSSFCFCMVGLGVSKFKDMVFVHELVTHMIFGGLASGLVTLGLYMLLSKDDLVTLRPAWAFLKITGSLLLGALIVPLECEVLTSLDRMMGTVGTEEA